jgi:hypothetical protein
MDTDGALVCGCKDTGYDGDLCDNDVNECDSNPCSNGGTCDESGSKDPTLDTAVEAGKYACRCPPSFHGDQCETEADACASSPCQNGGKCTDDGVGYVCHCDSNKATGTTCAEDTKPCDSSPCKNSGACGHDAFSGVYTCTCEGNFAGDNCDSSTIHGVCTSSPCQNGGTCDPAGGDTFKCTCAVGWAGDTCEESDPCAPGSCANGGKCSAKPDGATGITCDCTDTGFTGDTCGVATVVDPCASKPCAHGGTCDANGTPLCKCTTGRDGDMCEGDVDECADKPCKHASTCTESSTDPAVDFGAYSCACAAGWNGDTCAANTDDCKSNPCQNGGACTDGDDAFICACADDYAGDSCETPSCSSIGSYDTTPGTPGVCTLCGLGKRPNSKTAATAWCVPSASVDHLSIISVRVLTPVLSAARTAPWGRLAKLQGCATGRAPSGSRRARTARAAMSARGRWCLRRETRRRRFAALAWRGSTMRKQTGFVPRLEREPHANLLWQPFYAQRV